MGTMVYSLLMGNAGCISSTVVLTIGTAWTRACNNRICQQLVAAGDKINSCAVFTLRYDDCLARWSKLELTANSSNDCELC